MLRLSSASLSCHVCAVYAHMPGVAVGAAVDKRRSGWALVVWRHVGREADFVH